MRENWMVRGVTTLDGAGPVDIVIAADRISAIGTGLQPEDHHVGRIVDGDGLIVIPGLVNGHLHSHDRFDRGRFDALPLEIWMGAYNPPTTARQWTPRQTYLRTLLNGIELLRSGTTTVIDDVHLGPGVDREVIEAVFAAYDTLGLRASVTISHSDLPFYKTIPYLEDVLPASLRRPAGNARTIDETIELWRELAASHTKRVRFALSPSGPQRCSPRFLTRTQELARELDLPVITHVLETRIQALTAERFFGRTMVEHMEAIGALDEHSVLVHCVWVNEADIERINQAGASVVHCPASNLKLGSGVAPVPDLLEAGVNIALGTDNNNGNDSANLLEVIKLAATLHRSDPDHHRWPNAGQVLTMATMGGARAARLDGEIGQIAVGMKADLVFLDRAAPPFVPAHNLERQLVFAESGSSIRSVVIDGQLVLGDGVLQNIDEQALMNEIAEQLPAIAALIGGGSAAAEELAPHLTRVYDRCTREWGTRTRETADSSLA
jgi:5-methylthioadenosine/S-adenosylhomocysteine deaminase